MVLMQGRILSLEALCCRQGKHENTGEVETVFTLLLLLSKEQKWGKLLANFIQTQWGLVGFCKCVYCLSFVRSVTLLYPISNNNCGDFVLADVHWFHSCFCEPLQDHPRAVWLHCHGAIQQAPHGRDRTSHLCCGQRVLPLPLEASRQPVYPHQVNGCCFDYPWQCTSRWFRDRYSEWMKRKIPKESRLLNHQFGQRSLKLQLIILQTS